MGRVGAYVYQQAVSEGHDALGVDLSARNHDQAFIAADLTDFGAAVDAFHGADAIIHLAAIPDSRIVSTTKTFSSNMTSLWNVYEAARVLGIKRVVFASTIQTVATVRWQNRTPYQYFPLDEAHPVDPQTDYALSKALGERVGDMFAKQFGITAVSLRFMGVTMPEELGTLLSPPPADSGIIQTSALFAYCDVRDTARACVLAAAAPLPASTHTTLFVTARDTWVDMPSADLVAQHFPNVKNRGLQGYDSLISGETALHVLGFEPRYSCRTPSA